MNTQNHPVVSHLIPSRHSVILAAMTANVKYSFLMDGRGGNIIDYQDDRPSPSDQLHCPRNGLSYWGYNSSAFKRHFFFLHFNLRRC
jgi:hypothetical protein